MYDLEHRTYVVLEFAAIDGFRDKIHNVGIREEEIIEIAAVKIEKGKIQGHFHSFIAIDGYDARNIDFEDFRVSCFYAGADHLIGAPSFKEVAERLKSYVKDSVLIIRPFVLFPDHFKKFKEKAQCIGIMFNNPVINIGDIQAAVSLKNSFEESGKKFENTNILELALILGKDTQTWPEIFADYDIFFNPYGDDSFDKGRNDPLSWALAFAKFFVAVNIFEQEEIDETKNLPF